MRAATSAPAERVGHVVPGVEVPDDAEARQATEVTKVLTIYAAIMLPLSLIAGFFGMNVVDLPGEDSRWAWVIILGSMGVITALSLAMFVALDWIGPLSGRQAGRVLGRGLIEVSKTPVQLVGALYEVSTTPLRSAPVRRAPEVASDRARRLLRRGRTRPPGGVEDPDGGA